MHLDWTAIGKTMAVGGGLFYAVQKFFDVVGDKLNDDTRLEIAVWLLGVKVESLTPNFQMILHKYFTIVCGGPASRRRFYAAAAIAALVVVTFSQSIVRSFSFVKPLPLWRWMMIVMSVDLIAFSICFVVAYYCMLYADLIVCKGLDVTIDRAIVFRLIFLTVYIPTALPFTYLLLAQYSVSMVIPHPPAAMLQDLREPRKAIIRAFRLLGDISAWQRAWALFLLGFPLATFLKALLISSSWLWLFIGSSFIIKAARRFDIGFDWFNRHFDIEKRPLQSIGLVAGALVAIVYWAAVIVSRVVG